MNLREVKHRNTLLRDRGILETFKDQLHKHLSNLICVATPELKRTLELDGF